MIFDEGNSKFTMPTLRNSKYSKNDFIAISAGGMSVQQARSYIISRPLLQDMEESDISAIDGYQTGVVKWFDTTRGYGFIVCDSIEKDIFVHQSAIIRQGFRFLEEGDEVQFLLEKDSQGKTKAKDVLDKDGNEFEEAEPTRGYPYKD